MFVTAEDFNTHPYNLPDLDKVINSFNAFIKAQEEEQLRKVLGHVLYESFIAGLDEVGEGKPDQRWKDLRDGVIYSSDIYTYKWIGMKKLLVPYLHAMWIRATFETPGMLGVVRQKAENATVVNPSRIIVEGYNTFSRNVGNKYQLKDTLYGFLYYSEDTYLDSIGGFDLMSAYLCKQTVWPDRMNVMNI